MCQACEMMNSSISYEHTSIHSCNEYSGQRSYRFVVYNHHMGEPKIDWVSEDKLSQNQLNLLSSNVLKEYEMLPSKAKAQIIVHIMRGKL